MKKIMFNDRYGLTKAVLEGRKTMTRRIIPEHISSAYIIEGIPGLNDFTTREWFRMKGRYKPGEVVAVAQKYKDIPNPFYGRATDWSDASGWENKMFVRADLMPHQIRITNVRVERLQDISDEDCRKEGIDYVGGYSESYYFGHGVENIRLGNSYREAFAALIDKVSGKGTWASNPWVFVCEFELVK